LALTVEFVMADATDRLIEAAREVKPRLRGWLHLVTLPLAVIAGVVLIALSPDSESRLATTVFTLCASMLFGSSALYHRGRWSQRGSAVLRRLDHSSFFLLIAGTYTPFALMLLNGGSSAVLLILVWAGALAGIAFRVFWLGAPTWLYLPVYIALGWSAVFWLGDFAQSAGPAVLTLIIVGGCLYSLGGLIYGLKRPNPAPRWYGFHEVFHSFTIAAFVMHYIGLSMVVYSR
jgi:hemolysin III